NGRRADLMGIDPRGQVVIVEIKTARSDLLGDGKWPDYLDFCDRFYWGLPPELDRACLEGADFRPECCGVIVADEYDAEIVRPAGTERTARGCRSPRRGGAAGAPRAAPPARGARPALGHLGAYDRLALRRRRARPPHLACHTFRQHFAAGSAAEMRRRCAPPA